MRFMDLLAKRYASPFLMVEEMLDRGRFYELVCEVNLINAEEEKEKKLWDIWLHRVFDKSFDDWKQSIEYKIAPEASETEIEATVKNSFEILNGFNLTEGR